MSRLVLDASVFVSGLVEEGRGDLLPELFAAEEVHIPFLCDIEVVAGLRRAIREHRFPPEAGRQALTAYRLLAVSRHEHEVLLARILALRDNFSPYDATYVALAEELDAGLLTLDGKLARAVAVHAPRVAVRPVP